MKLLLHITITEFPGFTEPLEKLSKDTLWSTRSFTSLCTKSLYMTANVLSSSRGFFCFPAVLKCCSCSVLVWTAIATSSHHINTHYTFVMGNWASVVHMYLVECLWCKTWGNHKNKTKELKAFLFKAIKTDGKGRPCVSFTINKKTSASHELLLGQYIGTVWGARVCPTEKTKGCCLLVSFPRQD